MFVAFAQIGLKKKCIYVICVVKILSMSGENVCFNAEIKNTRGCFAHLLKKLQLQNR